MTNKQTQSDVIIIGGGLAGLTAAVYLARAGKSVTVFEKSHRLGGRAETQTKNGFHFNLGPHALYRSGAGVKILNELDVEFSGQLFNGGGFAIRNNRKYALPSNPLSLLSTKLLSWPGKIEVMRVLATLGKIDTEPLHGTTIQTWLKNTTQRAEVRQLLEGLFRLTTYVNDVDSQSAGAAIAQMQLAAEGKVYYLDRGWQTLVDNLIRVAKNLNVKIVTEAKVAAIEWDSVDGVRGVRLANGSFQAVPIVLVAAGPVTTSQLVERSNATILQKWVDAATPVVVACLDVGLKRLPQPKTTFAIGVDRPLYLSVHSAVADLAANDGATVNMAKYLPVGESTNPDVDQAELEALLDLVQPGWREVVVERRFLPNMTVSNAVITAAQGGTSGRPGPNVPGIAGLYVAGDWVGPTGMLADASFASAKQAAEMILAAGNKRGVLAQLPKTEAMIERNASAESVAML